MGTGVLLVTAVAVAVVVVVVTFAYLGRRSRRQELDTAPARPWQTTREQVERPPRAGSDPRIPSPTRERSVDALLRRVVEIAATDPRVDAAAVRLDQPGQPTRFASIGLPPDAAAEELIAAPQRRKGHRAVKLTYLYGKDEPPGAIRAGVIAPLLVDDAQVGTVALYSLDDDGLRGLGVKRIEALARAAGHTLEDRPQKPEEPDASLAGELDELTGLGTRQQLIARLGAEATSTEPPGPTTVLAFDVIGLDRINEASGAAAGDCALAVVAQALAREAGTSNCFRTGGDEFAVVLSGGTEEQAAELAERVGVALELAAAVGFDALEVSVGMATRLLEEDVVVTLRRAVADLELQQAARRTPAAAADDAAAVAEEITPLGNLRSRQRGNG